VSKSDHKLFVKGMSYPLVGGQAGSGGYVSNSARPLENLARGTVTIERSSSCSLLTIRVAGRFDFRLYDEFRAAYQQLWRPGVEVVVDGSGITALDSSALGILLLLREFLGEDGPRIYIRGCSPEILAVFERARFVEFFSFD